MSKNVIAPYHTMLVSMSCDMSRGEWVRAKDRGVDTWEGARDGKYRVRVGMVGVGVSSSSSVVR